jgi:arsenate reductase
MKNVLVLCTGNSCRSQLAHGYLNHFKNHKDTHIFSAGIETHGVNPKAIEVMLEENIDISNHTSNHVLEYGDISFDYIITVCDHANEHCPNLKSEAIKLHFNFPDPAKVKGSDIEIMEAFISVRKIIKDYCKDFIENNEL